MKDSWQHSSGVDDEVTSMYAVADDGESDMLDNLRERAGIIWTHYSCWTNTVADGPCCEQCGQDYHELRAANEASYVNGWEQT